MARERRPKRVQVWKYDDGRGVKLDVPVYMVEQSEQSWREEPRPTVLFRVAMTDPDVNAESPDINALKIEVWAQIKARLTIEWTDCLEVTVRGSARATEADPNDPHVSEDMPRASVEFTVNRVQVATAGGKPLHRYMGYSSWGETHEGAIKTGRGTESYNRDRVVAVVADTPEMRRGLDAIGLGFASLIERLGALVETPEAVRRIATAGPALLPAPNTGRAAKG